MRQRSAGSGDLFMTTRSQSTGSEVSEACMVLELCTLKTALEHWLIHESSLLEIDVVGKISQSARLTHEIHNSRLGFDEWCRTSHMSPGLSSSYMKEALVHELL